MVNENAWKKEVSTGEILFYLEEMIEMDLADEIEQDAYIDIKHTGRCNMKKYTYVVNRIHEWQEEKF